MGRIHFASIALLALVSRAASAQDQPFVFTLTNPAVASPAPVRVDSMLPDQAFTLYDGDRPETRAGVQVNLGSKLTVFGRVGTPLDRYDIRGTTQQTEALVRITDGGRGSTAISVGSGVRREADGTNVWLGRAIVGRTFARSQVYGNVLIEKAFGRGRDAADLVTSFGWSLRIARQVSAGVEAVGEDLEGFWSSDEKDGGARLLIGPSVSIAPSAQWRLAATAGPILHSAATSATSTASRDLPVGARNGYAARATLTYTFK
jgi:hypothetical protein